jgi:phospholipase C
VTNSVGKLRFSIINAGDGMALLATNLASQNPLTNRKPMYALPRGAISVLPASSNHQKLMTLSVLVLLALTPSEGKSVAADLNPTTPIRHVVVIYDENISFDHYFGTYPHAVNGPGEVPFHAAPGTPTVNGLSGALLSRNPNSTNPFRLDRADAITCETLS